MAIDPEHVDFWKKVFTELKAISSIEKVLIIGAQDIRAEWPQERVKHLFESWGWKVDELDFHDPRANLRFDLNEHIQWVKRYDLVFDIGTLEHIDNSHQALVNYHGAIIKGGWLFLLTPIRGYAEHGFHTFSEEYLRTILVKNNYLIRDRWYLEKNGTLLTDPNQGTNVLLGVLAYRPQAQLLKFQYVQQQCWIK